jgi:hypothetical protein
MRADLRTDWSILTVALIPKLIVRSHRAGRTACYIRATARRNRGALTATRAQSEQVMTCEHTVRSRQ